jgi:hypothetical protein
MEQYTYPRLQVQARGETLSLSTEPALRMRAGSAPAPDRQQFMSSGCPLSLPVSLPGLPGLMSPGFPTFFFPATLEYMPSFFLPSDPR